MLLTLPLLIRCLVTTLFLTRLLLQALFHGLRLASVTADDGSRGEHGAGLVEDDVLGEALSELMRPQEDVPCVLHLREEVLLEEELLLR